ncbi:MAG: hypothetical protein UU24_C0002G0011 [Candidatus Nomurabacteria bacterium GW2011_GWA2_40_9]|uniref:Toxin-antitoxin system, toxin component, RelE family n=1 Tax=Candidatus Nomurabacteria bacterium GW2011_GWA2_40_9 TaxID=1618734 RepID=A0A0G0W6D7_9BACT|nr:MAG: hypothetical protein UU24_C0002G0011 [Candidatus Nomurabacteria bacterium GW2011_GWA2_40_9]
MNITNEYQVTIELFAERHFIRTFAKKYKGAWDTTLDLLLAEFKFIDALFLKNTAEYITNKDADIVICKTEFKIAGTQESRHGSGNRCIVAIHKKSNQVKVLLVYYKTDLGGGSETGNWKNLIKESYKEYKDLL